MKAVMSTEGNIAI